MSNTQLAMFATEPEPSERPKRIRNIHPSVPLTPATTDPAELIAQADVVVLNTSGGKDSQAALAYVSRLAAAGGVLHHVTAVHADLGDIEWQGTRELAERQARLAGITRFEVVKANGQQGADLLQRVRLRYPKLIQKAKETGKPLAAAWPSSAARWCTSDLKRNPIRTLLTTLATEQHAGMQQRSEPIRPVRILNVLGQRAAESAARSKLAPVEIDRSASSGNRHITTWRPIHHWSDRQVWQEIAQSGLPYHPAYDWGMRRLSCRFCVLACESDLVLSARLNPAKAAEYAAVEVEVERDFKQDLSMREIVRRARELDAAGTLPQPKPGTAMAAYLGRSTTDRYLTHLAAAS
ncbi:phosphoadenosine phosphosulfate reductase family protein (plasmid) [Actinacidiphila glaucinigra]|uniref:phosphoadenosine phosphosulfate reductase family protein n=1 Tax=Actinacidiphila glaucinigra TaxID=235986 RepID=UPI002DDA585E|nr:phosphoadenosine phosphosulfate reductase family protein [Actinacidiphila glaucinigra]WSD65773.1 phosphoadenosine phosphosulfate reductase family protein [Actinacidiphila glaucinigra]